MTDSATDTPDPSKSKAKLGTLRALWPFVRQHAGLFAAWLCALALASAATLSFPVAFKQMIDGGFHSGGNIDQVFLGVFIVVLVLAIASAAPMTPQVPCGCMVTLSFEAMPMRAPIS